MGRRYRIGQAAEALGLNPSVLRFWESEFPQLAPLRTRKGQRLYDEEHLALLGRIRVMLHEEGLTIEGARRRLEAEAAEAAPGAGQAPETGDQGGDGPGPARPGEPASKDGSPSLRREMVEELLELKKLLGK